MPKRLPHAHKQEVDAAARVLEQQDMVTPRSLSDSEFDKDTFRLRIHRARQGVDDALKSTKRHKWVPDDRNAIKVKYVSAEDHWHCPSETFTCPGAIETASDRSPTPDHQAVPYRNTLKQYKLKRHHRAGTSSERPPAHRRRQSSRGRGVAPRTGASVIVNDIPHFPAGPHDYRAYQRLSGGIQWQVDPGADPAHPRRVMTRPGVGQVNMLSGRMDDVRFQLENKPPREAHVIDCTRIHDPEKLGLRKHDGRNPDIIRGVLTNGMFANVGLSLLNHICTALDGNQVTFYLVCRGNKHRSLAVHMILIGMCVHLGCFFHTPPVAKSNGKACYVARPTVPGWGHRGVPCRSCLQLAEWSLGTWSGLGRSALHAMGYSDAEIADIRPQQRADLADRHAAGLRLPRLPTS